MPLSVAEFRYSSWCRQQGPGEYAHREQLTLRLRPLFTPHDVMMMYTAFYHGIFHPAKAAFLNHLIGGRIVG
ncbi:hypothetical protein D3C75_1136470 [compost metagenome]